MFNLFVLPATVIAFIPASAIILFVTNRFTEALCLEKEIPAEKHHSVFRTINVLITLLLITSYLEIAFTAN